MGLRQVKCVAMLRYVPCLDVFLYVNWGRTLKTLRPIGYPSLSHIEMGWTKDVGNSKTLKSTGENNNCPLESQHYGGITFFLWLRTPPQRFLDNNLC
jgi:hypothetical protein